MGRPKIQLPQQFNFSTELLIRISDINYGGHLDNASVLAFAHEARIRFLEYYGLSEVDIDGAGMMMSDASVVYKSEGFHGDILTVEVAVTDIGKFRCTFVYRLSNRQTNREIARVETGLVFYDKTAQKMVRPPEDFLRVRETSDVS